MWRWLVHPRGVNPSLHILLTSCFVSQCFSRNAASGVLLSGYFQPHITYVRPSPRRWAQRSRFAILSAGRKPELVRVFLLDFWFGECVVIRFGEIKRCIDVPVGLDTITIFSAKCVFHPEENVIAQRLLRDLMEFSVVYRLSINLVSDALEKIKIERNESMKV